MSIGIEKQRFPYRSMFITSCAASIAVLVASLAMELVLNYPACQLCKLQRLPYLFILGISLAGVGSRHQAVLLRILQGCLILGFIFSAYHTAVIYGNFADPCASTPQLSDLESFKTYLELPPPCSALSWTILGIPASILNSMLNGGLLLLSVQSKLLKAILPIN